MKKITLLAFLFYGFIMLGQQYQIQIRLVDSEVGYPTGDPDYNDYEAVSNDPGLNAIFQNYSATHYFPGYYSDMNPEWENRTHFILCNGCNINQFEQDLLNYNSVIAGTFQSEPYLIANVLYVRLVDLDNGNNTGNTTPEGIVITNNSILNSIFVEYNVLYFEPAFPSSQNPESLKVFNLSCECFAGELATALEAETTIIEGTSRQGFAILETEDLQKNDFKIYPNPIGDNVVIDSSEKIILYEIINLLGQSIFKGNSQENLNDFLPSLSTGNYLFNLVTESGNTQAVRFIKK